MMNKKARHQTMASSVHEALVEEYDFNSGERVRTCDGISGKVTAVHDGPVRGAEEYIVELDNGLGGGRYTASQLEKESTPVESSRHYTADIDYPELREIIHSRPDPSKMEYTALRKQAEFDPGLALEEEPPDYQSTVIPGLRIEDIPEEELPDHSQFESIAKAAFIQSAVDQDFRFQFTSAWKDVVAKAKRIRSGGGVQITAQADGVVYGNVQGDTQVYETGIERLPNSRTAVSSWSCGCKWGAYHWGAEDALSRFSGRQCSHSLALQYEAQARGMFGKTVSVDYEKPSWVPNRVVVKYDRDSGENIRARSSLSLSPASIIYSMAMDSNSDLANQLHTIAAAHEPFGDSPRPQADTSPHVPGATKRHDPLDNPGSSGFATGADPSNWGSIQENDTFSSRMSSKDKDECEDGGSEAELKDEPEGALPETTARSYLYENAESLSPNQPGDDQPSATNTGLVSSDTKSGENEHSGRSSTHQTEVDDVLRSFQSEASYLSPGGISAIAVKDFSFSEQQELINEGKGSGSRIRNFDRLSIQGTQYESIEDNEDDSWLS